MSTVTLERRVKALELQVAQLQDRLRTANGGKVKDWRQTIGALTGDDGLQEILQEAMHLRDLERRKARPKPPKRKPSQ